jgi:transposase
MFRSGREFAAWLGLTPKSHSSGGKDRLGRISQRGDRYIRHLLYVGAGNAIRFAKVERQPVKRGYTASSIADLRRSLSSRWLTRWHASPGR